MKTAQQYLKKVQASQIANKQSTKNIKNKQNKKINIPILTYSHTRRSNISQTKNKKTTESNRSHKNNYKNKSHSKEKQNTNNKSRSKNQTVSNTVPINFLKQSPHLLEFPFQAIKFKQPSKIVQTHEELKKSVKINDINNDFIQYDQVQNTNQAECQQQINMILIDNPKKRVTSYNQRLSRYSNKKNKQQISNNKNKQSNIKNNNSNNKTNKNISHSQIKNNNNNKIIEVNQVNNNDYQTIIFQIFRYFDKYNKGTISANEINIQNKKLPQAILYFLGSIFHSIRQKQLILSFKQFKDQSNKIYLRSSKQDIKWFIKEMKQFNYQQIQGQNSRKQQKQKEGIIQIKQVTTLSCQKSKTSPFKKQNNIQESKVQQKVQISKIANNVTKINDKNLFSFNDNNYENESSLISFRKKNGQQNYIQYTEEQESSSFHTEYQSNKNIENHKEFIRSTINITNSNNQASLFSLKKPLNLTNNSLHSHQPIQKGFSLLNQHLLNSTNNPHIYNNRKGGQIKKNIINNKTQDLKQQIYAKLQKMKLSQQEKQNNFINMKNLDKQCDGNKYNNAKNHQDSIMNVQRVQKNQINYNIDNSKINNNESRKQCRNNITSIAQSKLNNSKIKPPNNSLFSSTKKSTHINSTQILWQNKNTKIRDSMNDLKKIQQQFNKHKQILMEREKQRQNYFKDQLKMIETKVSQTNQSRMSKVQQESRIMKLFDSNYKKNDSKKSSIVYSKQQIQGILGITNESKDNSLYEKNINILSNLSGFKKPIPQNNVIKSSISPNPTNTLSSSLRKSIDISLPLKEQSRKVLSQKKQFKIYQNEFSNNIINTYNNGKLDKIDQLSQKIQSYLKKNAQKIQLSKLVKEEIGGNLGNISNLKDLSYGKQEKRINNIFFR